MIDIEELRRLLNSTDMIDGIDLHANIKPIVRELLDRLEAADRAWKETDKSCWDLTEKVIPNLRESLEAAERDRATFIAEIGNLCAKVEAAERERDDVAQQLVQAEIGKRKLDAECDALRTKIEEMEQQEPVAWYSKQYGFVYMSLHHSQFEHGSILYLRNGAPAWRIEGSAKVALLDIASLPHGTVFYALPGAKGE